MVQNRLQKGTHSLRVKVDTTAMRQTCGWCYIFISVTHAKSSSMMTAFVCMCVRVCVCAYTHVYILIDKVGKAAVAWKCK